MTNNNSLQDEEEPLDPKVEAIRVKMVRLLAVSGGIMFFGFMSVMAAIVYKWNDLSSSNPTPASEVVSVDQNTIAIPKGAKILSTSGAGLGVVITLQLAQLADGTTIIQRHSSSGKLTSRFSVIEE